MKTISKTITINYKYLSPSDAGKMLRQLHRKHGLSYKFIAEQIGVSPVTISRWASGENVRELHPGSQIRLWELVEHTTGESGKI